MLRALVLVSGALAAAGVVLSIFVLQRHKGARVGLSVIAVLMLFSASFVSGLLPRVWREPAAGRRFRPLQAMCDRMAE